MSVPLAHIERARDPRDDFYADLMSGPTFCTHYLAFDTSVPPFDDVTVRRAFTQALDVDKIVSVVMRGAVDRASTLVPPGILGHNADMAPIPFSPEATRSLLSKSSGPLGRAVADTLRGRHPHHGLDVAGVSRYRRTDLHRAVGRSSGHMGPTRGAPTTSTRKTTSKRSSTRTGCTTGSATRTPNSTPCSKRPPSTPTRPCALRRTTESRVSRGTTGWSCRCGTNGGNELVQQYVIGYQPPTTRVPFLEDIYFEQ